ncbi:MAG: prephenate dehydrogenase/arogenate dehydrogenase family protein [Chlamydiae bacterium]|nr:prephenate dehydrogenase/arogenate dehydrogenase family protein [Chlamydiota bacterium]MBI3265974.1 prephenate dehydrogenase/arogenate dehydrogenase family protein [Chlamydiota bacterium]
MTLKKDKICIIGMGLIGASLALSLKKNASVTKVIGVVHHSRDIKKILNKKMADVATTDVVQGVLDCDWIILAVPPSAVENLLKKISPFLSKKQIVTDVVSVKGEVMQSYRKILGRKVQYMGAHPIAGSEKKGPDAARANLFEKAVCILTPDTHTSGETLQKSIRFWKKLKMTPVVKSAEEHDKIFAYISHLPHLLSFCLAKTLSGKRDYLGLAGEAWRDMTRIAHSSPKLWAEISSLNQAYLKVALHEFLNQISQLEKKINKGDPFSLLSFFEKAGKVLK